MYCGVPATTPVCVMATVVHGPGQAEVGDLDPLDAVFEQDVGRLDVAVDQPLSVGGRQPRGRLHADPQDLLQLQPAFAVEPSCSDTPVTYCMTRYGSRSDSSTAWIVTT